MPAEYDPCVCHGVRNTAKKPGTVLDTQERIHWEGADGFSLKNPMLCNISTAALILLGCCLCLCIHYCRARQGRGGGGSVRKEGNGWLS